MSDQTGNPPSGGAPAPAVFDVARALEFGEQYVMTNYPDAPVGKLPMLRRVLGTATSMNEVPQLISQYFGASTTSKAAAPAPVTPPIAPSDTGPPAGTPGGGSAQLPDNPFRWGPEVMKHMEPREFREAVAKWEERNGMGNPMAASRRLLDGSVGRVNAAQAQADVARQLEVLNRKIDRR